MRIEYHPAVRLELKEIRDYYESQSGGLGTDFVNELEHHLLAIAAMPTRWMIVKRDVRRTLMRRFPYVIFFRIVAENHVRITVIKHEKRHPSLGLSRD